MLLVEILLAEAKHESIYYAILSIENAALRAHYIIIVKICANITSISLQNVGNLYLLHFSSNQKKNTIVFNALSFHPQKTCDRWG